MTEDDLIYIAVLAVVWWGLTYFKFFDTNH